MSRQARFNPMSTQFAGQYPENVPVAGVMVYERPSDEWTAAHPDAAETGEKPGNDDIQVSLMLTVQRVEPSALYPGDPSRWRKSDVIPLGPMLFQRPDGQIQPAVMTMANFIAITPVGGDVKEPALVEDAKPEEVLPS